MMPSLIYHSSQGTLETSAKGSIALPGYPAILRQWQCCSVILHFVIFNWIFKFIFFTTDEPLMYVATFILLTCDNPSSVARSVGYTVPWYHLAERPHLAVCVTWEDGLTPTHNCHWGDDRHYGSWWQQPPPVATTPHRSGTGSHIDTLRTPRNFVTPVGPVQLWRQPKNLLLRLLGHCL